MATPITSSPKPWPLAASPPRPSTTTAGRWNSTPTSPQPIIAWDVPWPTEASPMRPWCTFAGRWNSTPISPTPAATWMPRNASGRNFPDKLTAWTRHPIAPPRRLAVAEKAVAAGYPAGRRIGPDGACRARAVAGRDVPRPGGDGRLFRQPRGAVSLRRPDGHRRQRVDPPPLAAVARVDCHVARKTGVCTTRPVVNLSFALDYAVGGLNTLPYHLTNVAVHLVAGLLLFGHRPPHAAAAGAARPLRPGGRAAGAGRGPAVDRASAQTQAVTYVVQRYESMMGLFYLLAVYARDPLRRPRRNPAAGRPPRWRPRCWPWAQRKWPSRCRS